MSKRAFPLDQILFSIANSLGLRGFVNDVPDDLHKFLTGRAPNFMDLEGFEVASVTCGLILQDSYPELAPVVKKTLRPKKGGQDALESDRQFNTWLRNQERKFGSKLDVTQISASKLRRYSTSARGIALRNLEATGVDLTADPGHWD